MTGKTVNVRELRDPRALPDEVRRIAKGQEHPEARDILGHAADELERLQGEEP